MIYPNPWRLVLAEVATQSEIDNHFSLDDVDLWNLLLDAIEDSRPETRRS